jgi:hypothetical protein
MLFRNSLPAIIMLIMSLSANARERLAVFEFDATGVDEPTNIAATQVLRNELEATGDFSVIPRNEMESILSERGVADISCYDLDCAVNYGTILDAPKAITGTLTKLGESLTAQVRLIDIATKEVVFTDRFTAASIDDLQNALAKLAKAIASREKIESELTRFIVTDEEMKEPPRKKAYVTAGAALGGSFPTGDSYSDAGFLFYLGVPIRIEARHYVFENLLGLHLASVDSVDTLGETERRSLVVFAWDMGMRYVFNRQADFTPFVGGGLGIHFIQEQKIQEEDYYGQEEDPYIRSDQAMALHLAAGLYGLQSYNVHISFELKYAVTFTNAFQESKGYSHMLGLMVGITTKVEQKKTSSCLGGNGGGLRGGCF